MTIRYPRDTDRTLYNVSVPNPATIFEDLFGEPTQAGEQIAMTTVADPPSRETLGLDDIKADTQDWLDDHVKSRGFPKYNEFGEEISFRDFFRFRGEVAGLFDPIDATLEIPLLPPELFTAEFVRSAQRDLLVHHPIWRLHVCGTYLDQERGLIALSFPSSRLGMLVCNSCRREFIRQPAIPAVCQRGTGVT